MKAKRWLAVALTITLAGSATNVLAQTIVGKQDEDVTKIVQTEDTVVSSSAVKAKPVQKENDTKDYTIEKAKKSTSTIKKTKADLSAEDAVARVVRKIRKTREHVTVKKVTDVELIEIGLYDDRYVDPNSDYRAYVGFVLCEENMGFKFTIHSITGQVTDLSLVSNKIDACYNDPAASEKLYKKIESAASKSRYEETAAQFVSGKLGAGKVKNCEVMPGSFAGELNGFSWKRITASVHCEMEDGTLYVLNLDPQSQEIISWSIWGWGSSMAGSN